MTTRQRRDLIGRESVLPKGGVVNAVAAAALFGVSTPLAKLLLGEVEPLVLAGMLYLGSGLALTVIGLVLRMAGSPLLRSEAPLTGRDVPWLLGAIGAGGVAGPALLMLGLSASAGSTASLLLNLEGVFTALLAWFVFRENFDKRIALGMAAITAGGLLLSWGGGGTGGSEAFQGLGGPLAIAGACLAWGVDNNLTKKISGGNPAQIAALKGLAAGPVNIGLGLLAGAAWPSESAALACGVVGLLGYGVSLMLFVLALRKIGAARTGAYFSLAPFIGATVAFPLLGERVEPLFLAAAALMAVGLYLHLTERHDHTHAHQPIEHNHRHVHDEHHQHQHTPNDPRGEPHTHPHRHEPITHAHPHYPDLHHQHTHG